jgi:hypothetical protein
MLELPVPVRLATAAVFAVGAGLGWWLRARWSSVERKPPLARAACNRRQLHWASYYRTKNGLAAVRQEPLYFKTTLPLRLTSPYES